MIAIIFVILIHSCGILSESGLPASRLEFVVLTSLIHTGVPLFLMLSGALLLGKEEELNVFLKKRFARILTPFLIWSFIFYILLNPPHDFGFLWDYPLKLLTGKIHTVYWFVYTIIGLYLLTPVLRPAFKNITLGLWTGGLTLSLFILHAAFKNQLPVVRGISIFDVQHLLAYVGGFLIVRHLSGKPWLRWVAPCWAIGWMGMQIAFGILRPSVTFPFYLFTGFGLFAWMTTWHFRRESRFVTLVSETSYGIYLCHAAIISAFVRLTGTMIPEPLTPFATGLFTFAATTLLMWGCKKCRLEKILF